MEKIRVLFPYVEAGYGHIMPMRAMEQSFREKYGERAEIVSCRFFRDGGRAPLQAYERMLAGQVRLYNRFPLLGFLASGACQLLGTALSALFAIRLVMPRAYRAGVDRMKELAPDVVFSTHWATNYYAEQLKPKPLTVTYCPDIRMNRLFDYPCDLKMITTDCGCREALRRKRNTPENLIRVPILLRKEALSVTADRKQLRRELGLPEDNFTVLLVEGGYGIGRMAAITRRLIRERRPLTVIPVCGTNEALYRSLCRLRPAAGVTLRPYRFTERMPELEAAADVFCGKGGTTVYEAAFFGIPALITGCTSLIERDVANHFIGTVGSALRAFSPKQAASMVLEFAADPSRLEPYRLAARRFRGHFGAGQAADALWERIGRAYPECAGPAAGQRE